MVEPLIGVGLLSGADGPLVGGAGLKASTVGVFGAGVGAAGAAGAAGLSFGADPVEVVFDVFLVLHPVLVEHLYDEPHVVVVVVCHKFCKSIGSIRSCSMASARFCSRTTYGCPLT